MARLSPEEEHRLIAEVEALRDDPDAPLTMIPLQPAKNPRATLTVELPFETIDRLQKAAEANDLSLGEAIGLALDALETADAPPAEDVPEASPPPRRGGSRRKSARAS